MLLNVKDFHSRVQNGLGDFVDDLAAHTGRGGDEERHAWHSSLPVLARVLDSERLRDLDLYLGNRSSLDIEYRLPSSCAWADAVLLGNGPLGPAAVIIELKHWTTHNDRPGRREGLMERHNGTTLHPSAQVKSYVEYCQRFHSAIRDHEARTTGCVLFTRSTQYGTYLVEPNTDLVQDYPVFSADDSDLASRMPEYLLKSVNRANEPFAIDFSNGIYKQDRRFIRQIASTLRDPKQSAFVLLDEQYAGFLAAVDAIEQHLNAAPSDERLVVLIEGPPGSGKTIVAAHLWAEMARHPSTTGNCVLVTTSSSQRKNWEHLFTQVTGHSAARGIVVGANRFNPGMTLKWVSEESVRGPKVEIETWKSNLERWLQSKEQMKCRDRLFDVSIIDEAHALIDPSARGARGVPPSGWLMHAGPQAWHIIRGSRVAIFLMDSAQSYRDNETTTPASIKAFAGTDFGAQVLTISLGDAQYRCGGSTEYTDWVDSTLGLGSNETDASDWRRTSTTVDRPFTFELTSTLAELDSVLAAHASQGDSVRLLASYARPWATRRSDDPHAEPMASRDFVFADDGTGKQWSRVWNYIPNENYAAFIHGLPGSPIAEDPLCEVGCPYVVRGFDFDYVGLLWLSDIVRRGNQWIVQTEHVFESSIKLTLSRAKKGGPHSDAGKALLERLLRGYRILLTRPLKGIYVWCEDPETRDYLSHRIRVERVRDCKS